MDGNWFGHLDAKVGFVAGVIAGLIKLFADYLLVDTYSIVLVKVFFTAVVGGFGGVIGKHLVTYSWAYIKKRFNKNKNKQP